MGNGQIRSCSAHGYFRGGECKCGEPGRLILDEKKTVRLGKTISGVLRHFPDKFGLDMDRQGWVDIERLIITLEDKYQWFHREHLFALVESDIKQRYEVKEDNIRARYAHSVEVDLDLPPNELPELYYGATEEEADRILEIGLKPVRQRYLHLSSSFDEAIRVAKYRTEQPIVIIIDAQRAQKDGINIMRVNDRICLSEVVPTAFLELIS